MVQSVCASDVHVCICSVYVRVVYVCLMCLLGSELLHDALQDAVSLLQRAEPLQNTCKVFERHHLFAVGVLLLCSGENTQHREDGNAHKQTYSTKHYTQDKHHVRARNDKHTHTTLPPHNTKCAFSKLILQLEVAVFQTILCHLDSARRTYTSVSSCAYQALFAACVCACYNLLHMFGVSG